MLYSQIIKTVREKLLLTQEELATALGVNSVTVCRWETGKCEPTIRAKRTIRKFIEDNNLMIGEENG